MVYKGCLRKMRTSLQGCAAPASLSAAADVSAVEPCMAQYSLNLAPDAGNIAMHELIGQKLEISFTGNIYCIHCHKKTSKSFAQGYCYPCFMRLAECDMCIIKPEKCHYEQGTCRDNDWAHAHCMQPHVVYLANSSGLKVGITRLPHVPSRWIDQGAIAAMPILQVMNRYQSGMVEITLAQYINDKTNWRKMLKNEVTTIDLAAQRKQLLASHQDELQQVIARFKQQGAEFIQHPKLFQITYPVQVYPQKITSLSLDKQPLISSKLQGIKGQYLLLEDGVMNVRKFAGYEVTITI